MNKESCNKNSIRLGIRVSRKMSCNSTLFYSKLIKKIKRINRINKAVITIIKI